MGTRLKRVLNLCGRGVPVGKTEALQRENKMGVLPVNRLLVTMAVPMVVSMLVQALYNVVDSMFVAQINECTVLSLHAHAQVAKRLCRSAPGQYKRRKYSLL